MNRVRTTGWLPFPVAAVITRKQATSLIDLVVQIRLRPIEHSSWLVEDPPDEDGEVAQQVGEGECVVGPEDAGCPIALKDVS